MNTKEQHPAHMKMTRFIEYKECANAECDNAISYAMPEAWGCSWAPVPTITHSVECLDKICGIQHGPLWNLQTNMEIERPC